MATLTTLKFIIYITDMANIFLPEEKIVPLSQLQHYRYVHNLNANTSNLHCPGIHSHVKW